MKQPEHHSASAAHYNDAAKDYDAFNDDKTERLLFVVQK